MKEYVRITEKVKKGRAEVYDGVVIQKTETFIECFTSGPQCDSRPKKNIFYFENYDVFPSTREQFVHYMIQAIDYFENKVMREKIELAHNEYMLEGFKKEAEQYT